MLLVPLPSPAANVATMQTDWRPAVSPHPPRCRILAVILFLLIPVACLGQTPEPVETIRVDSDLVDLKVSVLSLNPQNPSPDLQQRNFLVLEDGKPQDISFFAAADTPFDLVLLLDLSGSSNSSLFANRPSGLLMRLGPSTGCRWLYFLNWPRSCVL
jgi:hypothetical protein